MKDKKKLTDTTELFHDIDYRKLVETIMDELEYATLIDDQCRVIYMSKNYYEGVYGLKREDVIGKHIFEIVPDSRIPAILKGGKKVLGEYYHLPNGVDSFANRFPIRIDDNRTGLFAEAVIYGMEDVVKMNQIVEQLRAENSVLKDQLHAKKDSENALSAIIGVSKSTQQAKELVKQFADSNLAILITGETGTGKEVYANAIHNLSRRRNERFVKINCAAIPENLLESELFGYEKGAFTGASNKGKIGKFELANGGTILLDEIGDMPLSLQAKLLRVLQEQKLERVGGVISIPIDVRIICTTNRDLKQYVKEGKFRSDLYYRINTVEIRLAPLRERPEDIQPLCKFFVKKINEENGVGITGMHKTAAGLLEEYAWEGNVRELQHVLERACVAAGAGDLTVQDFHFLLERILQNQSSNGDEVDRVASLADTSARAERSAIIKALVLNNGNKSEAARALGINRQALYQKIKKYNIKV